MTSQGVDGTVDKAGRIWPDSNQRANIPKIVESQVKTLLFKQRCNQGSFPVARDTALRQ